MKKISIIACTLLVLFNINPLYAQQSNFQVTSPPIPWYEFTSGQKDLKAGITGLYMTGTIDDPDYGGDVAVYGGGASMFYRYAFRDEFAIDAGGTVIGAAGEIGRTTNMKMAMVSIPVDLEFQPVRSSRYSVILFGGFNFTWMNLWIDYSSGTDSATINIATTIRGPQGGIQAAIKFEDFVLTPFFMIASFSGKASIDYSDNSGSEFSVTSGVPATKSYFYGADLIYRPLDMTLSSVIQQVMASGDNSGYRTYVLMLSFHFEIDPGNKSFEIEPAAKKDSGGAQKNRVNSGKKYQQ